MSNGYEALALDEIQQCASRLREYVVRTPVLEWTPDARRHGHGPGELWLKLELFQRTGTFKARGALNKILQLQPYERRCGVTAVSAGNHAIATAWAARVVRTSAKVVMIKTANPARVARARGYGAEIIFAEDGPSGFALAQRIQQEEGRTLVHPFEGPEPAQGAATVGLEFAQQVSELEAVVIAVGGGGLCAGVAAALKQLTPSTAVYGVEPEGAANVSLSLAAGSPLRATTIETIADSLAPPVTLPYAFGACQRFVDDIVLVTDEAMRAAMSLYFNELKLAVEPAGAASIAAVLGPLRSRLAGKRVGAIVCGSNIDAESFFACLKR